MLGECVAPNYRANVHSSELALTQPSVLLIIIIPKSSSPCFFYHFCVTLQIYILLILTSPHPPTVVNSLDSRQKKKQRSGRKKYNEAIQAPRTAKHKHNTTYQKDNSKPKVVNKTRTARSCTTVKVHMESPSCGSTGQRYLYVRSPYPQQLSSSTSRQQETAD